MFSVIGIIPANNEMNVLVSTPIEIVFSKDVEENTIDPNTVYLQNTSTGDLVPATLTYVIADATVVLTPDTSLLNGIKYRTYVVGADVGVMAADGEFLTATNYYEFATEPSEFIAPTEPDPTDPVDPTDPTDPTDPIDPVMLLEVMATYPKDGAVNVTPSAIKVLLTSAIDPLTATNQSVYLIKKRKPAELNTLDLMTEFASEASILTPLNLVTLENANTMISISLNEGDLEANTEYTLIVRESIGTGSSTLGITFASSFYTAITPLYVDPEKLREDMRSFLSNIPDLALYRRIQDASIEARDIISSRDPLIDLTKNLPNYVEQYVKHKAAYELIVNAYLQDSKTAGSSRSLGDLTVNKESGQADITKMLRELKDRIKPWLDQVHGHNNRGYAKPSGVVRGENIETYPDFFTRTEFTELGG